MKRSLGRKKESGAQRRARKKLEVQEAKKSCKPLVPFFEKPGTSGIKQPCSIEHRSVAQESEANVEKDGSEAATKTSENVDEESWEADMGSADETDVEDSAVAPPVANIVQGVITEHDIGLLKFNKDTGRAIIDHALRTEIIKLGPRYFQNSDGPFLPTDNRSMTKSWFKRRLGNGRGEEVTRSWIAYSPSKKSAFCMCCLLFSRTCNPSSLEQEGGFKQWKSPDRITLHENPKNHRECFAQWK